MFRKLSLALFFGLALTAAAPADDKKEDKPTDDKPKAAESYVKVEIKGKLLTGIAAIGGETTGVMIRTGKDLAFELDLKGKELKEKAEKLNDKTVIVTGALTMRRGVERGARMVVEVSSLKAVE